MSNLYKILVDGKSCHGGKHVWSLPTDNGDGTWTPGAWTPPVDRVRVCETGWHLTSDPMQWPAVGMQVFDAEGDGTNDTRKDKTAFARARLLRPSAYEIPPWWREVESFVRELPGLPWLQPDGNPDPAWRLSTNRAAAGNAAWDAAWSAAGNAAWSAARDAALWAIVLVCDGLPLDPRHVDHARARMDVWRKGYGLLCDVGGVLYVYERIA